VLAKYSGRAYAKMTPMILTAQTSWDEKQNKQRHQLTTLF
jgi:hypothetical protein